MAFTVIHHILQELQLQQYSQAIEDNDLTDNTLIALTSSGILVHHLKEIIPPLGHRLVILQKLNQHAEGPSLEQVSLENISTTDEDKQVMCTICSNNISSTWDNIWDHLRYFHFFTQTKQLWECPFCNSKLLRFRNFKDHVKCHTEKTETSSTKPSTSNTFEIPNYEAEETQITHEQETSKIQKLEELITNIRKEAVKFVVQLKSNGKLSLTVCNEILGSTTKLINSITDLMENILKQSLAMSDSICLVQQLKNPFSTVSSDYLLKSYLQHHNLLIPSQEVVLGSSLNIKKGKPKMVFETYQFVPIEPVLLKILSIDGVMKSIITVNSNIQDGIFNSPVSGMHLREKLQQYQIPVVFLLFYYDEVEVCNPLGSRHGLHKLGNCYFSLLNANQQYSSKLDNIYLCCSFKSVLLRKYSISKILERVINALKNISKTSLYINSEAYFGPVQVCLGQVTGDNLGFHQIFGFSESFVCNFPCRFCRMPRYKCQTAAKESKLYLKTKENYENDLKFQDVSKTGVKSDSIFNSITDFHITENYCPDIMHDILEGVAPINIKLLLNYLLKQKQVTIDQINSKISSFNYGHLQKDKPSPFTSRTIESGETLLGQSAGQTYCLLQNFAFIFAENFEDDTFWNFFLIFLDIMDIIMSPCISETSLPYLKSLIEDHHIIYQKLSNRSLRPKHHHMLHYPEVIRQIGPLSFYWTMRFEARHKFFKHVAKVGSNFKNISKTVSDRNQLLLSFKLLNNKPFNALEIEVPQANPCFVRKLTVKRALCLQEYLNIEDEIFSYKFIKLNGTLVQLKDNVLFRWVGSGELPVFVRVIAVYNISDTYKILSQVLKTIHYERHYHSYAVDEIDDYVIHRLEEFDLFKPLLSKTTGNKETVLEMDTNSSTVTIFTYQLSENEKLTSKTSDTTMERPKSSRIKRMKLMDEEQSILDIKSLLLKHDSDTHTNIGAKIMETCGKRQPLPFSLRCKLVNISCQALMTKTNSTRPSTDQRQQLAACIVDQLFDYMTNAEKQDMKLSYFTPSSTYRDSTGKSISKRPIGYIQSHFVHFWQANKPLKVPLAELIDKEDDKGTPEELSATQEWLKFNKAPPAKVFERLNQTMHTRRAFIKRNPQMASIVEAWPRLFDVDGAIQNDFGFFYPLAADNLLIKWNCVATKIMDYAAVMKRQVTTLGILADSVTGNLETAALFMLAFLIKPKNKKISQANSAESFIKVVQNNDLEVLLSEKNTVHPQVVAVGSKTELKFTDFLVLFQDKAQKCSSLVEAVDLSYKSYYVLHVEFPGTCFGAYQFLDYAIYKMKPVCPVQSAVKELTAFVASETM